MKMYEIEFISNTISSIARITLLYMGAGQVVYNQAYPECRAKRFPLSQW